VYSMKVIPVFCPWVDSMKVIPVICP
jgi:hypothetical protein